MQGKHDQKGQKQPGIRPEAAYCGIPPTRCFRWIWYCEILTSVTQCLGIHAGCSQTAAFLEQQEGFAMKPTVLFSKTAWEKYFHK